MLEAKLDRRFARRFANEALDNRPFPVFSQLYPMAPIHDHSGIVSDNMLGCLTSCTASDSFM